MLFKGLKSRNTKDGKPLRVAEAFSGIGAQHMALRTSDEPRTPDEGRRKRIPYKIVATADIDDRSNAAYDAIFKGLGGYTPDLNVGNVINAEFPEMDVLTYSFPCQGLSKANTSTHKGLTAKDSESSVLWYLADTIKKQRPEWLIMENVSEIHNKNNIADFDRWIKLLSDLGYTSKWQDLVSSEFGLPQDRKRTFMLSHYGPDCPDLPVRTFDAPPLSSYLEDDADLGTYEVSPKTRRDLMYGGASPNGHKDKLRLINDTQIGYLDGREGDGVALQFITSKHKARGRVKSGRAHTILTQGSSAGVIVRRPNGNLTVRQFTPREAYRLQGFPDWAYDRVRAVGQSDSDLYREAGNSLSVPVMREIFHVIDDYSVRNGYAKINKTRRR